MLDNIMTDGECSTLRSLLESCSMPVLCCHQNADGDALGAVLAMGEVLRLLGKEPLMVVPDQYPDYLQWLPNSEKIVRYDKRRDYVDTVLKLADLIICLDFNTLARTDQMEVALSGSPAKKVLIDHHLDPDVDAVVKVSQPKASSTCELVFRVVWQLELFDQLGKHFAVPVYCGMMTDTGGFTYNSTDCDIYYIISQLLTKRIDKDKIYRNVYHNYSEHRLRMVGHVLCNCLVVDEARHAAYYTLSRISLREDTEKQMIWVSLRSVDNFPCNEVAAQFFNGGGHLNASGGKLACTLPEAVEIVKQAFNAFEDRLK